MVRTLLKRLSALFYDPKRKRLCLSFSFIVYRLSDLFSGHGEPVPISGVIGHQGRIHPGRSANPSQGTHTLSFTHTTDNLEMPINRPCMSLDRSTRRKPANSTRTWRKQESNPQPWRCEANLLTTKPPCPHVYV
ncbi:hypothetical protein QTP70_032412, partial [Hemibagrus guttatus]